MKRNKVFILLLCLALLVACSMIRDRPDPIDKKKLASLYRIKRIQNHRSYYIIYATQNGATFKIVSEVDNANTSDERIRINRYYDLDIIKILPVDTLLGVPVAPNLGIRGITMPNGDVVYWQKRAHYALYIARNLNGVYLVKKE